MRRRFKKRLGQHMVVDRKLISRIAEYAELERGDTVLEVGCGTGNLTEELLKKADVVGIEKDAEMIKVLKRRFSDEIERGRFKLIHADALEIEFPEFTKFVSNIPYRISSPLLFKLFNSRFQLAVVMLQKEVAERLCGEDSRLGVVSKAFCRAEILERVKPSAFKPRPRVDSALVRIVPEPVVDVQNKELFSTFVTFAFSMRRKKMKKIVEEWNRKGGERISITPELENKRPEEIGAKVFASIIS